MRVWKFSRLISATALAGVAVCPGIGNATVTETTTMAVSATVVNTCTFGTVNALAFGSIDPTNSHSVTATFAVTCSANTTSTSISVKADLGLYSANATTAKRAMKNASSADYISYYLYDNANTSDLAATDTITLVETGTGPYTETGTLRAVTIGTEVPSGTYGDTLTLTATYN